MITYEPDPTYADRTIAQLTPSFCPTTISVRHTPYETTYLTMRSNGTGIHMFVNESELDELIRVLQQARSGTLDRRWPWRTHAGHSSPDVLPGGSQKGPEVLAELKRLLQERTVSRRELILALLEDEKLT